MNIQTFIIAILGGGLVAGLAQLVTALVGWFKSKNEANDALFGRAKIVLDMMQQRMSDMERESDEHKEEMKALRAELREKDLRIREQEKRISELELEVTHLRARINNE